MECLICRREFPLSRLCVDLPSSAGALIEGCKHCYCAECVQQLPQGQMRCTVCDRPMLRVIAHSCRRCTWSLIVEGGGFGYVRFSRLNQTFGFTESRDIINAGGNAVIQFACLGAVISTLPSKRPTDHRIPGLAQWMSNGSQWYPLFEGQDDPANDAFICTSSHLARCDKHPVTATVNAKWEGSPSALYMVMNARRGDGPLTTVGKPTPPSSFHSPAKVLPAPARLVIACEEFMARMRWRPAVEDNPSPESEDYPATSEDEP